MTKSYLQKLIEVFSVVDTHSCHVLYKNPIVFLCGGEVDVTQQPPRSVRGRFCENYTSDSRLEKVNFILAETFKDCLAENNYSELQTFEDDIAKVSSLVIVFLESPGSIAELGLFSNQKSLESKLQVFVPEIKVRNQDSFIFLGPLNYLEKRNPDRKSVCIYPWDDPSLVEYEHLPHIIEDVVGKLNDIEKTEKLDSTNSGHIAYLMYELIQISQPIKITELEKLLASINVNQNSKTISRLLYLLEKLELIRKEFYSSDKYYVSTNSFDLIQFGSYDKKNSFDKLKESISIRQFVKESSNSAEAKRHQVLKRIQGSGA